MAPSVEHFAVYLDYPDAVYSSGQDVNGKIVLTSKKPVKVPNLWLECWGEAIVSWPEPGSTYTRYRQSREEYFHLKACLYSQENSYQDASNDYEFSFKLKIPDQHLPPSYDSVHGSITYYVRAKIQTKNGKTKYKTEKTPFTIGNYEEYDEQQVEDIKNAQQRIHNGKDKAITLGGHCHPVGTVDISAYTNKILYQDGDIVTTNIHAEHQHGVEKITVALVRVIKYSDSHGHSTCYKEQVANFDAEFTIDSSIELAIPKSTYPTMQLGCNYIRVYYHIEVRLGLKNKRLKETSVKIPIIITSKQRLTPPQTPQIAQFTYHSNGHTGGLGKRAVGALFCVIGRPTGSREKLLDDDRNIHGDAVYGSFT